MAKWPEGLRNKDTRDTLALEICNELRAGQKARSSLRDRWQTNEKMYRNEPGASGTQIIDGVTPYHIPLTKPKLDRINGVVHHAITGIEPYVEVTAADEDGVLADLVEQDLTFLLKKAYFSKMLWESLAIAGTTGVGVPRVRYVDGQGFELLAVHPNDISIYPATVHRISEAKTAGMRFGKMLSEVKEMQKAAWDKKADVVGGWDPDEDPAGRNPTFDRVQTGEEQKPDDQLVQLWDFYTYRRFKDSDPLRWWHGTAALDTSQLLEIEAFGATKKIPPEDEFGTYTTEVMDYSGPCLFAIRYETEYGKFWPSTSLAQHLQGLQQAFSDGFNICWGGSWSAAFPAIIISGGSLNAKVLKYRPGDIIENPTQVQAQVIGVQFNPGTIPQMMQLISQTADSVTRVSPMGTASQLRSRTTATETGFLAEMQRQAEDQYTACVTMGLKEVFEYCFELYKIHFDDIKATFGPNILLPDASLLEGKHFLIEVNGKATTNAPTALIQKFQLLLSIAKNMPQLGLDSRKIVQKILSALELPFNVNTLITAPAVQPGQGGPEGQPPMEMGAPQNGGAPPDVAGVLSALLGGGNGEAGPGPGM